MVTTFFAKVKAFFNRENQTIELSDEFCKLTAETYYKKLAIESAINLIANTLSLAEFKTFDKGKSIRKENYYLFNIEPNQNQNANKFWRDVIHHLVYDNEALIIQNDNSLYVSDSFNRKEYAFRENLYTDITINDFKLRKTFKESEVFYLELYSEKVRNLVDGLYVDFGKLIEYSKNTYRRSNARRGILDIPTSYPQTPDAQENLSKLLDENFKKFFNAENGAVLPLTNNLKYTDLTNQTYKNGSDSRDIRSLIDDVFDMVAIAFQIPPQLLKGSIADSDNSMDNFMTFCIKSWGELIEKEINRKYYGKSEFLNKSYLKVDLTMIREVSLKDLAGAIGLLTRNGVNTLDDNLRLLGREGVGGELGQTRFTTLNLATMENALKGGDKNGQEEY